MKLSLKHPSDESLQRFLHKLKSESTTYEAIGSTLDWPIDMFEELPNSKVVDGFLWQFRKSKIGRGQKDYLKAVELLRNGECFDLSWVNVHFQGRMQPGNEFCLIARRFGIYVWNGCRVIHCDEHVVDSDSDARNQSVFSLVVGTLDSHAAIGEERLSIVWDHRTDAVEYLIGSFSVPSKPLVRMVGPLLRRWQNEFAIESTDRMRQIEPASKLDLVEA